MAQLEIKRSNRILPLFFLLTAFLIFLPAGVGFAQTLTSFSVAPADPGTIPGQTQQFTATGTFSDGSTRVLRSRTVITAGQKHPCALLSDGTVGFWRLNGGGQPGEDPYSVSLQSPSTPEGQEEASNMVLSWRREGGIAGFCDEMTVSAEGEVRATSCRQVPGSRAGKLSKEELARLDRWRMSFGSIVIEMKDSPGSDAMTVTLTLKGNGSAQPTDEERQEILGWAQGVYNQNRP